MGRARMCYLGKVRVSSQPPRKRDGRKSRRSRGRNRVLGCFTLAEEGCLARNQTPAAESRTYFQHLRYAWRHTLIRITSFSHVPKKNARNSFEFRAFVFAT